MKIAICSSLDFVEKIKEFTEKLRRQRHKVIIPKTAEMILKGDVSLGEIMREKENGKISDRAIRGDILKYYFQKIRESEAILVLNFEKNGIKNYIGGNVFLEMGFAHVLNKKIFLLNEIPEVLYKDEIKAMQPVVIKGDLGLINSQRNENSKK